MLLLTILLFFLSNVVFFSNVCLLFHIFESWYWEMVLDVFDGDRIIGMVFLRFGWEEAYEGFSAIYEVGCAGFITHVEWIDDGCYNFVLRGFEKFRIQQEDQVRSYW